VDLPRDNRGNGFLLMLYGDVGGGCGSHGARLPRRGIRGEHELRRHPVREGRQTKVSLRNEECLFYIFSEHFESNIFRSLSATECRFTTGTDTHCRISNLKLWNQFQKRVFYATLYILQKKDPKPRKNWRNCIVYKDKSSQQNNGFGHV
jgi:hypothetical protein